MTLELEIDVPESREVTLPPEVPVGRTRLTVRSQPSVGEVQEFNVVLPDPPPPPPTADKFEREKAAFYRLLPALLTTHRGQYVAIHDEKVVDAGTDKVAVADAARARFGDVEILVRLVTDVPRVVRIPSVSRARDGVTR